MMDFSKFDNAVNMDEMRKNIQAAQQNTVSTNHETPDGEYVGRFERLTVGETRDGRPMLKAMFRITEGAEKKHCLFMNRVLYGTRNDANMISSAVQFLNSLEPSEDIPTVTFESYSQFSELVDDIFEDVSENVIYNIRYEKDAFNNITILDCYDADQ